jgi:hypothetical protein
MKKPDGQFEFFKNQVFATEELARDEMDILYQANRSAASLDAGYRSRYVNHSRELSIEKLDSTGRFYNCVNFYRLEKQEVCEK